MAETRNLSLEQLLEQSSRPIDWLRIAAVDMRSHRTAFGCEMRWRHLLDVRLNQGPWTNAEDERLRALATKWGERNWDQVGLHILKVLCPCQSNECATTCKHVAVIS